MPVELRRYAAHSVELHTALNAFVHNDVDADLDVDFYDELASSCSRLMKFSLRNKRRIGHNQEFESGRTMPFLDFGGLADVSLNESFGMKHYLGGRNHIHEIYLGELIVSTKNNGVFFTNFIDRRQNFWNVI